MSDADLMIIQQTKYPMDMPANVIRPADIPSAALPETCICLERTLDVNIQHPCCCCCVRLIEEMQNSIL